jgi:hypothetical protein
MGGEQFDEKDSAFINDAIDSVNVPYGETVILKRYTGVLDPGDPAQGIQATYQYTELPVQAIIQSVSQQDVLYSGGIYQIGDIRVSLAYRLNIIDTISQIGGTSQGDRIIYLGHEYRTVGKIDYETLIGRNKVYSYVFRKIGNG